MNGPAGVETLLLPDAVRRTIAAAAVTEWPDECCGLLAGADAPGGVIRVTRAVPSPNRAAAPRRRFEIDPQVWLDLRNALAGTAERIVGCYHSHPGGPAAPSARDLADAWEPDFVWLIVAVHGGAAGDGREETAWLFEDGAEGRRFRPLALRGGAGDGA